MLDREAIALQCSLLSAQACGLSSVEDYRLHPSPLAASQQPNQQPLLQGQSQQQEQQPSRQKSSGSNGHGAGSSDATTRISDQSSAQPQVIDMAEWHCTKYYSCVLLLMDAHSMQSVRLATSVSCCAMPCCAVLCCAVP